MDQLPVPRLGFLDVSKMPSVLWDGGLTVTDAPGPGVEMEEAAAKTLRVDRIAIAYLNVVRPD